MKTYKRFRSLLAFCLTLLTALSFLSAAAGADSVTVGSATTGGLTVTLPAEENSDSVKLEIYRLIEVRTANGAALDTAQTTYQPVMPAFTWVNPVAEWLLGQNEYENYVVVDTNTSDTQYAVAESFNDQVAAATLTTLYDKMANAIKQGTNLRLTPVTAEVKPPQATITGLPMGQYLVLIENGIWVYRPSVANLTPTPGENGTWVLETPAVITPKATPPQLTKFIIDDENHATNPRKEDNYSITDTVYFELETDVPVYPVNAINKGYYISDTLPAGLTLNPNSIKVYGYDVETKAETALVKNTAYTVGTVRPDSNQPECSFVLNFVYEQIRGYEKIRVRFNTIMNQSVVLGTAGNINKAWLDYNNNPYDAGWKTLEDDAKVYTYGLEILKVNEQEDEEGKHPTLEGAEFTLKPAGTNTAKIKFVKVVSQGSTIWYPSKDAAATEKLVSDKDGLILIHGLDAGSYVLTETQAPPGHSLPADPNVTVTLTDAWKGTVEDNKAGIDGLLEIPAEQTADSGTTPPAPTYSYQDTISLTIVNTFGSVELPETGGSGTELFYVLGLSLCTAAAAAWLIRRKTAKD